MPKNLSAKTLHGYSNKLESPSKDMVKKTFFSGDREGQHHVVIVPRNKKVIPQGTLSSIWRQAGITKEIAEEIWKNR